MHGSITFVVFLLSARYDKKIAVAHLSDSWNTGSLGSWELVVKPIITARSKSRPSPSLRKLNDGKI